MVGFVISMVLFMPLRHMHHDSRPDSEYRPRQSTILERGAGQAAYRGHQIGKYRGRMAQTSDMCECSKVHLYEVEFKLDGMIVVPTHKNCGFALGQKQADKFQKDLVRSWGFEDEED